MQHQDHTLNFFCSTDHFPLFSALKVITTFLNFITAKF